LPDEISRFDWNRIPEDGAFGPEPATSVPVSPPATVHGQGPRTLPPVLGKKPRKRLKQECLRVLSGGIALTAEEVTQVLGYAQSSCRTVRQLLNELPATTLGPGARYTLQKSADSGQRHPGLNAILDPECAKLVSAVGHLADLTPLDEVMRLQGITGPVDMEKTKYFGVATVLRDGREFVGTHSLINKKISAATTVLSQLPVLTMDEIEALFYPLMMDNYVTDVCGDLIGVPGGYVSRKAAIAKLREAVERSGEVKPLDEIVQMLGLADQVDWRQIASRGFLLLSNDGRDYVGTQSMINRKISGITATMNQGRIMTMDEIKAVFHPLPIEESYLAETCGELVEVPGGYVGRKAAMAKLRGTVERSGEFKTLEEIVQVMGLGDKVDWRQTASRDFILVANDGRDYVGTQSMIDRKIRAITTTMNQGRTMTMDEIKAVFHPLPVAESYLAETCGELVGVPGGYVSRKAIQAVAQKSVGAVMQLITRKGFASASEITGHLQAGHAFEVPVPDLGTRTEVLLCQGESWYFLSETTKPLPFFLGATRAEAGLPERSPIKAGSVFVYLSARTALVSEAARMLKISVPKVKKMISDQTLEAFTYGKTTRVSVESLLASGAVPYEKSAKETEAAAAIDRVYPVTRTDVRLSPVKRGVRGSLGDRIVSLAEAASLLALERGEIAKAVSTGILKPVDGTDCLSATDILSLIEDRSALQDILNERLVTTYEAVEMLGVSKSFVYDMYQVIKKRGQNEYGMNLYRRGDVLQYVGKVEELICKVRMIRKRNSEPELL